ncbi:D-tyrosyl-tRNA deacylase [Jimgerdemannia flammicorona]|uniref:D-aminoacyl-tRNA deacylase n=1 Tax=Jimgerdemannia flammicorona TaxID=994334 RepID=A0A433DIW4_9FUNG|nr:D-tyrosyl-tRNA deacylase [Jimgerdemannia flammicorona]
MRAVLQRVARASVSVNGDQVSAIGRGLCILLGIAVNDTDTDIDYMVRKILSVRVFNDDKDEMWKKSVKEYGFELLCGTCVRDRCLNSGRKSRSEMENRYPSSPSTVRLPKPDFHLSMKSAQAKDMYDKFLKKLGEAYEPAKIKGPVTLELDSRKFTYTQETL